MPTSTSSNETWPDDTTTPAEAAILQYTFAAPVLGALMSQVRSYRRRLGRSYITSLGPAEPRGDPPAQAAVSQTCVSGTPAEIVKRLRLARLINDRY